MLNDLIKGAVTVWCEISLAAALNGIRCIHDVHHGFDNRGKWLNPQRIYGERKIRLPEVVVVVIVVLVMMVIMVEVMVTVVMVTGGEGRQWRKAISEGR